MDIGYVAYCVNNPILKDILSKYVDDPEECMEFNTNYAPDDNLTEPDTLEELLDVLPQIMKFYYSVDEDSFRKDIEEKKSEILCSFRYAKWNNGYQLLECNEGHDIHYTYSSRWGVFRESAYLDPMGPYMDDDDNDEDDEDDEDYSESGWEFSGPTPSCIPDEAIATFVAEEGLIDEQKLAQSHLYDGQIEIEDKAFYMCGCLDSYSAYSSCEVQLGDNPTEAEMISCWLSLYNSKLLDVNTDDIDDIDYLVVRLDPCEEIQTDECKDAIKKAIEQGIKIISEQQLWNSLFIDQKQETEEKLNNLLNPPEDNEEKKDDDDPWKKEKELGFWVKKGKLTCYGGNAKVVIIPETITEISSTGFNNNYGLSEVRIPLTINKIEDAAFSGCRAKDITVDEEHPLYKSVDGVLFDKSMKRLIAYPCGRDQTTYTIPEGICEIAPHAFYASQNLTEIIFPTSLEIIGENGFALCSKLKDVKFPEKLQTIGAHAFDQCSSLECVSFPEGLKIIGPSAFYSTKLQEVNIPKSLSVIEEGAFSWIPSLVRLTIPEGVTKICDNAFSGSNLTEVIIPFSVVEMEMKAFGGSYKLKKIIIPAHLNKPSVKWMFTSGAEIIVKG